MKKTSLIIASILCLGHCFYLGIDVELNPSENNSCKIFFAFIDFLLGMYGLIRANDTK